MPIFVIWIYKSEIADFEFRIGSHQAHILISPNIRTRLIQSAKWSCMITLLVIMLAVVSLCSLGPVYAGQMGVGMCTRQDILKKLPISLTNLSKKAARRHDITLVLYNHGSSAHSGKRRIVCV